MSSKLAEALDAPAPMEVEEGDDVGIDEAEMLIAASSGPPPGMCVECEDQPEAFECKECEDRFCEVCFVAQHRRGKRRFHTKIDLRPEGERGDAGGGEGAEEGKAGGVEDEEEGEELSLEAAVPVMRTPGTSSRVAERSRFIPLRLSYEERRNLRLLEAALHVSEYTDKVDIISYRHKAKRIHEQLQDICAILSGLMVATDYRAGQRLVKSKSFVDNAAFFQTMMEIGRRHKVMNPEKMRSEYGKLIYLLQDSEMPHIRDLTEFSLVTPLRTVHLILERAGGLELLSDEVIEVATREVVDDKSKSRAELQREIRLKNKAIDHLAAKYRSSTLDEETIKHCLYSISDNNSFLTSNRDPVDRMIAYLTSYFRPDGHDEGYSLAIRGGLGGARLTHSHDRQYHYVLQSLMLWREVQHDMFKLWYLAEQDLLDPAHRYYLTDTGQGLNRVQPAPRVGGAMRGMLHAVQTKVGRWVGSSVIHLGDHNVPNAFMFIDKYTQVPRILTPIVTVIEELPRLARDPHLADYFDALGGIDTIRKDILLDFFRHAFDGSGATNFFDAGSCIDGRLTSAWNWCSLIHKKPYFHIFSLTGFIGFDGDFQK